MFTNPLVIVTLIAQIILSLILIVVVLFQSSNQEGLSGAIAGGAETFFGKNQGKTFDAKLKKLTAWVAVLFLISSVLLGLFVQQNMPEAEVANTAPVISETAPELVVENDAEVVTDAEIPEEPENVPAE